MDMTAATPTHIAQPSAGQSGKPRKGVISSHSASTVSDWKKLISSGSAASDWCRIRTMLIA